MAFPCWRSHIVAIVFLLTLYASTVDGTAEIMVPDLDWATWCGRARWCGNMTLRGTEGTFTNRDFADSYYRQDQNCTYRIIVPEGSTIQLRFPNFKMSGGIINDIGDERDYDYGRINCNHDYIQVWDGDIYDDVNFPRILPPGPLEAGSNFIRGVGGRLCHDRIPPLLSSHSNIISVRFVTNSLDEHPDYYGFRATWTTLIGKHPKKPDYFYGLGGQPRNATVMKEMHALFPCHIKDLIMSNVLWLKDGFPLASPRAIRSLPGLPRHEIKGLIGAGQYNLQIYPVHAEDQGWYQCLVVNAGSGLPNDYYSSASERAYLTVRSWFTVQPTNYTVHEGQTTQLRCNVVLVPGQSQWLLWNKDGESYGEGVIPDDNGDANLLFTNVTKENEGWYQCITGTFVESSRMAYLGVIETPDTPALNWYGGLAFPQWGDAVTLEASTTRRGNPIYKFYRNGAMVGTGTEGTYTIDRLSTFNMGRYTATASFGGGRESGHSNPKYVRLCAEECEWYRSFGVRHRICKYARHITRICIFNDL